MPKSPSTKAKLYPGRVRYRHRKKWAEQVASNDPRTPLGWICPEAGTFKGRPMPRPGLQNCSMCMGDGILTCGQCLVTLYCTKTCQKSHWKLCHKFSCKPNPRPYIVNTSLSQFSGISEDCFKGHEVLCISSTSACSSVKELCESGSITPADDFFDIFPNWSPLACSSSFPRNLVRNLCKRFNWPSGYFGMAMVSGYSQRDNTMCYAVMYEDSFSLENYTPSLNQNLYAHGLFPMMDEKKVRGNMAVLKLRCVKKSFKDPRQTLDGNPSDEIYVEMSDDEDVDFTYEFYPLCIAEMAHFLFERRRSLEQKKYTNCMWRGAMKMQEAEVIRCRQGSINISPCQNARK